MEASKESEEEPEKASCDGLDCAGCLAVPDYGCGFADGACYEAGKEPMDATSFAFSTADCEKLEASEEESPEEEELPECSCGINAVEGDEKFQAGSSDGDKMCEFGGANCASFFEGCDAKGATVCSLKIEYEVQIPDCSCGIGAVMGDEKFQAGSVDGDKMCEFGGANCASFFEGCDAKGATVCSLKIEYEEVEEELPECSCGIGAVEGDEKFQAGSADGDKMCEFGGANCATFFEGCDAKGATVCSLKIEYVEEESEEPEPMGCTRELMQCPDGSMVGRDSMNNCEFSPCPEVESEESAESEEEAPCSEDDCIRPCKGRRKPMCQVKKGSKCSDKKARGKGRRTKYFSKLACASTSQTFMYEPAQTAWTTEDIAIYGFAAVGLVALARGALIFGKQLRGGQYQPVEFDSEL